MSRLDELIREYCPDGVEFKNLEECCVILDNKRKPVTKSYREFGEYPYYGANGIQDYVSDYIFDGIYILVGEDGSVMTEAGKPVVTWATGKIWVNNHAHIIAEKDGVLLRYLYHYLQTVNVKPLIHGNIPKLTGSDFRAIKIPVPPLPVQREIVLILDNFTELTEELTEEFTARKKQYEFYRDKLLTFDGDNCENRSGRMSRLDELIQEHCPDGVEFVSLGQVAHYAKKRIDASQVNGQSYVGVENLLQNKQGKTEASAVPANGAVIAFEAGDILIGNIRPYLRKIWLADCNGGTNGDVLTVQIENRNTLMPGFLYYVLSSENFFLYDIQNSKGAKMPRGSKDAVLNYQIPVPPLPVQREIVSILDRFDALCNDLISGIPAEIEARRKQYEYYRDKLLTFNEK